MAGNGKECPSLGGFEQLWQLRKATWDGDLISKSDRDRLVGCGYVAQAAGWNIVTPEGLRVLANLRAIKS